MLIENDSEDVPSQPDMLRGRVYRCDSPRPLELLARRTDAVGQEIYTGSAILSDLPADITKSRGRHLYQPNSRVPAIGPYEEPEEESEE